MERRRPVRPVSMFVERFRRGEDVGSAGWTVVNAKRLKISAKDNSAFHSLWFLEKRSTAHRKYTTVTYGKWKVANYEMQGRSISQESNTDTEDITLNF